MPCGAEAQRREGVGIVGVADLPAGEGHRQSRRTFGLGVLQQTRRTSRHGPLHGLERRAHPRDRTPGPLEAGRRHGGPLHTRRDGRVGTEIFVEAEHNKPQTRNRSMTNSSMDRQLESRHPSADSDRKVARPIALAAEPSLDIN